MAHCFVWFLCPQYFSFPTIQFIRKKIQPQVIGLSASFIKDNKQKSCMNGLWFYEGRLNSLSLAYVIGSPEVETWSILSSHTVHRRLIMSTLVLCLENKFIIIIDFTDRCDIIVVNLTNHVCENSRRSKIRFRFFSLLNNKI